MTSVSSEEVGGKWVTNSAVVLLLLSMAVQHFKHLLQLLFLEKKRVNKVTPGKLLAVYVAICSHVVL